MYGHAAGGGVTRGSVSPIPQRPVSGQGYNYNHHSTSNPVANGHSSAIPVLKSGLSNVQKPVNAANTTDATMPPQSGHSPSLYNPLSTSKIATPTTHFNSGAGTNLVAFASQYAAQKSNTAAQQLGVGLKSNYF